MRVQLILLVIGLFVGFVNLNGQTPEHLQDAETLYKTHCATCHGPGVHEFVSWNWKYGIVSNEIKASITEGRAKGAMPQWGGVLTADQIDQLVSYLQYGFENKDKITFEKSVVLKKEYENLGQRYQLETIVDDMDSPWGMTFLPDGSLLVTEKKGILYKITTDGGRTTIANVPEVNDAGQGGLMDIELHPGFVQNSWIYLSYSKPSSRGTTTAVSRFRLADDELKEETLIFEGEYSGTRHHYGSRLEFGREGYLYLSMGDRGARDSSPQDVNQSAGKIHRIYDDGRVPESNPFVGNGVSSIYSYGHRNPQGVTIHPETGDIWTHEHGPKGGDEVNIIKKGANYGWPVISYGINYNGTKFTDITKKEGMEQPIHYWVPSIAPCGMDFVTSDRYPNWKGHLLVGSLSFQYLNLCKVEGNQIFSDEVMMKGIGRVRNVRQGPDGYIYVAIERPGKIYRLIPII